MSVFFGILNKSLLSVSVSMGRLAELFRSGTLPKDHRHKRKQMSWSAARLEQSLPTLVTVDCDQVLVRLRSTIVELQRDWFESSLLLAYRTR